MSMNKKPNDVGLKAAGMPGRAGLDRAAVCPAPAFPS